MCLQLRSVNHCRIHNDSRHLNSLQRLAIGNWQRYSVFLSSEVEELDLVPFTHCLHACGPASLVCVCHAGVRLDDENLVEHFHGLVQQSFHHERIGGNPCVIRLRGDEVHFDQGSTEPLGDVPQAASKLHRPVHCCKFSGSADQCNSNRAPSNHDAFHGILRP